MQISILRIVDSNTFISADAFEYNFKKFPENLFKIVYQETSIIKNILIDSYKNHDYALFENFFSKYNYVSFGYNSFILMPLFLKLRNLSESNSNLLFIAHAAGSHIYELFLSKRFLRENDIIIAPTESARNSIIYLIPELKSYIKTINHPINFENFSNNFKTEREKNLAVSLIRIQKDKLIHRVIDAIYILKKRGLNIFYEIGGTTKVPDRNYDMGYVNSLKQQIKRLGLEKQVKFVGEIKSIKDKQIFLSRASMLINLSVSTEETFGKSIVEAMYCNTPVIVTKWNGFPEVAGEEAYYVDVNYLNNIPDVNPVDIANAVEAVLKSRKTFKSDNKFTIKTIAKKYYEVLSVKNNNFKDKNKTNGVIDRCCISNVSGFNEFLNLYFDYLLNENKIAPLIMQIFQITVQKYLRFFHTNRMLKTKYFEIDFNEKEEKNIFYKIFNSIFLDSCQISKESTILMTYKFIDTEYLNKSFDKLKECADFSRVINFMDIEIDILQNKYGSALEKVEAFFDNKKLTEFDYPFLKQFAKIHRHLKTPEQSLKLLKKWLDMFPDSNESVQVWVEFCYNNIISGEKYFKKAKFALNIVGELSEDKEIFYKLQNRIETLDLSKIFAI